MKDGQDETPSPASERRQRLKERLRGIIEREKAQAAVLEGAHLESLKKASARQLIAAEATMKRDMAAMTERFTSHLEASLFSIHQNVRLIERLIRFSPLILITGVMSVLILTTLIIMHAVMALSAWSEEESLSRLGLSLIRQEGGNIILIREPEALQTCQITAATTLPCIIIQER